MGQVSIGTLVRASIEAPTPQERGQAFGQIVVRFQDMAFGLAFTLLGNAQLAEDAAQEAFLAAWRQLENLREPEAFAGWFQCIVRTQCNRLTRGKRLPSSPLHLVGETPAGQSSNPAVQAEHTERAAQVREALAALPEHERTATILYYLGDEDQRQIAEYLGVPVTTIKKRVFSARKRLRERMSPYMEPQEIVQETLDTKPPSHSTQFSRRVLLWAAVGDGNEQEVTRLLIEDPTLVRTTNNEGETPLHLAALCGYAPVVTALLNARADANAKTPSEQTPLHLLAEGSADVTVAGLLLAAGADLMIRDARGETPLSIAARYSTPPAEDAADHFGLAEFFLSRGAVLDLHTAAALDRADDVPRLLEKVPSQVSETNVDGDTPLHIAARAGFRRVTAALLHADADPNAKNTSGQTPLHIAAQPGREKCLPTHQALVSLLREKGARDDVFSAALLGDNARLTTLLDADGSAIDLRDGSGATPLLVAAWQGHIETVRLLLARGADPQVRDHSGRSAMAVRWEAKAVVPEIVDLLAAAGLPMELKTALVLNRADAVESLLTQNKMLTDGDIVTWAVEHEVPAPLIERLAAYGAQVTAHDAAALGLTDRLALLLTGDSEMPRRRDSERRTPLHLAAERGQVNAVRFLLERGSAIDAVSSDGFTPLYMSCTRQHKATVEALLAAGAAVHQPNYRGETPLFAACTNGDTELAVMLLSAGTAVNPGSARNAPLHLAVQTGNLALVDLLLQHGANIDARNYYGATPLHIAIREGHGALATRLLSAGADKVARDQWHRTPLHVAAWFDRADMAELLLVAGIAVTELGYGFSTPLHTAAQCGSVGVGERLVAHGADVNARSDFGRTPLHDAVHGGHAQMVDFLLRHRADPTSPNNRQMTPLHWAAAAGRTDIARLLINAGADTSVRSYKDETPLELAHRYNRREIISLLLGSERFCPPKE